MSFLRKASRFRKFSTGGYLYGQRGLDEGGSTGGALGAIGGAINQYLPALQVQYIPIQRATPVDVSSVQQKVAESSKTAAAKTLEDMNKRFDDMLKNVNLTPTHREVLQNNRRKVTAYLTESLQKDENFMASPLNQRLLGNMVEEVIGSPGLQAAINVKKDLDELRTDVKSKDALSEAYLDADGNPTDLTNEDYFNYALTQVPNSNSRWALGVTDNDPYGKARTPRSYGNYNDAIKWFSDLADNIQTQKEGDVTKTVSALEEKALSSSDPTVKAMVQSMRKTGYEKESNSKRLNYYTKLLLSSGSDGRAFWRSMAGPQVEAAIDARVTKEWWSLPFSGLPDKDGKFSAPGQLPADEKFTITVRDAQGQPVAKELTGAQIGQFTNRALLGILRQNEGLGENDKLQRALTGNARQFREQRAAKIVEEVFTMGRVTNQTTQYEEDVNIHNIPGSGEKGGKEPGLDSPNALAAYWSELDPDRETFTPRDENGTPTTIALYTAKLPPTSPFVQAMNAVLGGSKDGPVSLGAFKMGRIFTSDMTPVDVPSGTGEKAAARQSAVSNLRVTGTTGRYVLIPPKGISPANMPKLQQEMSQLTSDPERIKHATMLGFKVAAEVNVAGMTDDFQDTEAFVTKDADGKTVKDIRSWAMTDHESAARGGLRNATKEERKALGMDDWSTVNAEGRTKATTMFVEIPNVGLGNDNMKSETRQVQRTERDQQALDGMKPVPNMFGTPTNAASTLNPFGTR